MDNVELLYVDLFSGAGGTSTGVETSGVAKVIACVNHDENAIASHAANHPEALHFVEDVRTLDLSKMTAHVEFMRRQYPDAKLVLWASLECTNFSKAKGGQPRDADSRTLAYSLYRHYNPVENKYFEGVGYIQALNPDYIHIENVEEFMSWGEMDENGKPISKYNGSDYMKFVNDICNLGYHTDFRILNSADFGAYTSRKRLFLQFAKHNHVISWPEPTHCKGGSVGLFNEFKKWKPVREVLDFTDEGVSIFERKKPLSDKTLERIYAGLVKFVAGGKVKYKDVVNKIQKSYFERDKYGVLHEIIVENEFIDEVSLSKEYVFDGIMEESKFISSYYGNGDNCSSIDSPSPTVTTKDRIAIVSSKFIDQQFGQSKPATVENPLGALTANPKYNLVSCNQFIMNQYSGGGQHSDIEKPCPAVTTTPKQNLITPWIMNTNFGNIGSSVNEPSHVITANRKWHYLMNPQYMNAGGSVDTPAFTLIARMDKMPPYLVQAESGEVQIIIFETDSNQMIKIKEFMCMYGIVDIKMRMLKIPELKMIMGFPKNYKLIGTQAEQKKYIGNAVEVTMARMLCKATVNGLINKKKIAI